MMRWYGRVIWPVGLDSRASAAALVWTARSETANATRIGHLRLACCTRSITQKWCGAAPTQYFEMFGNRGISKGWVGGPERSRDTTSDSHVKSRTSRTFSSARHFESKPMGPRMWTRRSSLGSGLSKSLMSRDWISPSQST